VLAGGCVPVGEGALPYAPIVEALRTLVAEAGVTAVRELVGPAWPELARLLRALGAPDRSGPPGQAAQARLFELLLGLLGRLGEQAPLVLVVEDLQWADLLPGERARLHTALARTIADLLGSGELDWPGSAGEVAAHWGRAHDLPKALEWSVRAGAEAVRHYGRALDLWDRVADAGARAGLERVDVLQRAASRCSASD
jgi:AAA ATPase domain